MPELEMNSEITQLLSDFRQERDRWERDWLEMLTAVTEQLVVMRDHYLAGRTREAYAAASAAADLEYQMLGDCVVMGAFMEKLEKDLGIDPDVDPQILETSV